MDSMDAQLPVMSMIIGFRMNPAGRTLGTGGAGLDKVQLSIKNNMDYYYLNGSMFVSGGKQFLTATGTVSWTYSGLPSSALMNGDTYTIHSIATDLAGNVQTSVSIATFTYDTTAPTVTINQASGQQDISQDLSSIHFTVIFSEVVTGFDGSKVTLNWTGPGTVAATVNGSGPTYDVAVSEMTGNGTLTATIAANAVQDQAVVTSPRSPHYPKGDCSSVARPCRPGSDQALNAYFG
jgi:hypothetical protein